MTKYINEAWNWPTRSMPQNLDFTNYTSLIFRRICSAIAEVQQRVALMIEFAVFNTLNLWNGTLNILLYNGILFNMSKQTMTALDTNMYKYRKIQSILT